MHAPRCDVHTGWRGPTEGRANDASESRRAAALPQLRWRLAGRPPGGHTVLSRRARLCLGGSATPQQLLAFSCAQEHFLVGCSFVCARCNPSWCARPSSPTASRAFLANTTRRPRIPVNGARRDCHSIGFHCALLARTAPGSFPRSKCGHDLRLGGGQLAWPEACQQRIACLRRRRRPSSLTRGPPPAAPAPPRGRRHAAAAPSGQPHRAPPRRSGDRGGCPAEHGLWWSHL